MRGAVIRRGKFLHVLRRRGSRRAYCAVTNIGIRPTFADTRELTCESHLLDYTGDSLYGRMIRLELVAYLRPERKFDSPLTLKAQINRDIERAFEVLA